MKKLFLMIALAAISFGSVYAHGTANTVKSSMKTDTIKKSKPKTKRDSTRKKDSIKVEKQ
jgi:hypothetical protein